MPDYKISVQVTPHITVGGWSGAHETVGNSLPAFTASVDSIDQAMALGLAFALGVKTNPHVREARVFGIQPILDHPAAEG